MQQLLISCRDACGGPVAARPPHTPRRAPDRRSDQLWPPADRQPQSEPPALVPSEVEGKAAQRPEGGACKGWSPSTPYQPLRAPDRRFSLTGLSATRHRNAEGASRPGLATAKGGREEIRTAGGIPVSGGVRPPLTNPHGRRLALLSGAAVRHGHPGGGPAIRMAGESDRQEEETCSSERK